MAGLTPSQTVGPFFIEGLQWAIDPPDRPLAPGTVRVAGRVLDVDGKAVSDALLEIWQPSAPPAASAGQQRAGFQRVATDDEGRFSFRVPGTGFDPGRRRTSPCSAAGCNAICSRECIWVPAVTQRARPFRRTCPRIGARR